MGTTTHSAALGAHAVSHVFARNGVAREVLRDIDLAIEPGEFVSLVGPSGCGKTTLLNMFTGLVVPEVGTISVVGAPPPAPPGDVAYMLAADALLPWRSAVQNVELTLLIRGIGKREARERSVEWLNRVGLASSVDVNVQKLSHGMRQRVAIARTLVQEPQIILMDEPFAALDAQTRMVVQEQFLQLWERTTSTIVLVTHDLAEAILLSDRVVMISSAPGRIVADVKIELPRPRHPEADRTGQEFVGYYEHLWNLLKDEFEI